MTSRRLRTAPWQLNVNDRPRRIRRTRQTTRKQTRRASVGKGRDDTRRSDRVHRVRTKRFSLGVAQPERHVIIIDIRGIRNDVHVVRKPSPPFPRVTRRGWRVSFLKRTDGAYRSYTPRNRDKGGGSRLSFRGRGAICINAIHMFSL